jgi:hypothetical protein
VQAVAECAQQGMAISAGWFMHLSSDRQGLLIDSFLQDPVLRAQLAGRANSLVDSEGATRAVERMLTRAGGLGKAGPS